MQCEMSQRRRGGASETRAAQPVPFPSCTGPCPCVVVKGRTAHTASAAQKRSADGGSTTRVGFSAVCLFRLQVGQLDLNSKKRGPFLALAQERNRVRLPSQITPLGRFYWLEGPGLSASHPPTLGRQVYVTQRSSCSCGWGMCSWPLRPAHMSVGTYNAR